MQKCFGIRFFLLPLCSEKPEACRYDSITSLPSNLGHFICHSPAAGVGTVFVGFSQPSVGKPTELHHGCLPLYL